MFKLACPGSERLLSNLSLKNGCQDPGRACPVWGVLVAGTSLGEGVLLAGFNCPLLGPAWLSCPQLFLTFLVSSFKLSNYYQIYVMEEKKNIVTVRNVLFLR